MRVPEGLLWVIFEDLSFGIRPPNGLVADREHASSYGGTME